MRAVLIAGLMLLGGCAAAREAAGYHRELAEKGIGFNTASMAEAAEANGAVEPADSIGPALPTGLGGDKANANYAPAGPKHF